MILIMQSNTKHNFPLNQNEQNPIPQNDSLKKVSNKNIGKTETLEERRLSSPHVKFPFSQIL